MFAVLLLTSTIVVTLVLITPALAHQPALFAASHLAFHRVCHQNPARTLNVSGGLLPVCARCTAIYSGLAVGLVASGLAAAYMRRSHRVGLRLLLIGFLAALMEYAFEKLTGQPSNLTRLIVSSPLGLGAGLWAGGMLLEQPRPEANPSVGSPQELFFDFKKGNIR